MSQRVRATILPTMILLPMCLHVLVDRSTCLSPLLLLLLFWFLLGKVPLSRHFFWPCRRRRRHLCGVWIVPPCKVSSSCRFRDNWAISSSSIPLFSVDTPPHLHRLAMLLSSFLLLLLFSCVSIHQNLSFFAVERATRYIYREREIATKPNNNNDDNMNENVPHSVGVVCPFFFVECEMTTPGLSFTRIGCAPTFTIHTTDRIFHERHKL